MNRRLRLAVAVMMSTVAPAAAQAQSAGSPGFDMAIPAEVLASPEGMEAFLALPERAQKRIVDLDRVEPELVFDADSLRLLGVSGRDRQLARFLALPGSSRSILEANATDLIAWDAVSRFDDPYAGTPGWNRVEPFSEASSRADYLQIERYKQVFGMAQLTQTILDRMASVSAVRPGVSVAGPPPLANAPGVGPTLPAGQAPLINNGAIIDQTYYPDGFVEVGVLTEKGAAKCTATLVARDWILTAAHCVMKNGAALSTTDFAFFPQDCVGQDSYRTTTGALRDRRLAIAAQQIEIFGDGARDFALVRLKGERPDSRFTKVAPDLPPTTAEIQFTIAGYGASIYGGEKGDNLDIGWQRGKVQGRKMLVWSGSPLMSDTCGGDSGGPIFMDVKRGLKDETRVVIGVVSGEACQPGDADYSKTSAAYLDEDVRRWVTTTIAATNLASADGAVVGAAGLEPATRPL